VSAWSAPVPQQRSVARTWRDAVTDADGHFTLQALPDGTFTLRVERDRYAVASQNITITGGSAPPAEFRMTRGQDVAVRVVDAQTGATLNAGIALVDAKRQFVG